MSWKVQLNFAWKWKWSRWNRLTVTKSNKNVQLRNIPKPMLPNTVRCDLKKNQKSSKNFKHLKISSFL